MKNYKKILAFTLLIAHITLLSNTKDQGTCESLKKYLYVDKNKVLETYNKFASQYHVNGNYVPNPDLLPDSLKTLAEKQAFEALKKENEDNICRYKMIPLHLFDNEYTWGPGWFALTLKHQEKSKNQHLGTAESLKKHPYANKNFVIRAYNEENRNLLSNHNDQLAYDDLIKENAFRSDSTRKISSVHQDNEYTINWNKIETSGFLTRK
ncbi:MAG: hypothetical protein K2X69_05610 [Silvanigrellaceae bacterium]|nr:hypothetical protein [Silvanigrellaceae bacterium]